MQTPINNTALFASSRRLPATTDTGAACWLTAPREGWTAHQEAKARRLSDTKEGRQVGGGIIVGHVKSAGRL